MRLQLLPLVDRYVARSVGVPLLGTLLLSLVVLVIEELARLMNLVAHTGSPLRLIWQMLAYLLPEYLVLAIPIALLLGVLLGFRNLARSAELDVLRAIGLGFGRLLFVPYVYAIVLMALTLLLVGFVEPIASYQFEKIGYEFDSGAAGLAVKVGEFNRLGRNGVLRIERSVQREGRLVGIFLTMESQSGDSIAVTAESGRFFRSDTRTAILLRLHRGRLIQISRTLPYPRTLSFETYDLPVDLPSIENFRDRGSTVSELTLPELMARSGSFDAAPGERRRASGEANARLAEVGLLGLLPLLAFSLAIPPKRGGSSLRILVGILIVIAFYKINHHAGEGSATSTLHPAIAVWTLFALLSLLIARMYWIIARIPGGQPIDVLRRHTVWSLFAARSNPPDHATARR